MNNSFKKLNILIYGEPFEWAMAANMVEAYNDLGHYAEVFDFTQFQYRTKGASLINRIFDRLFFGKIAENINNELLNLINQKKYDVLLVLKGIHIFPETIAAARSRVDYIANWNPDDFFNPLNSSKYLRATFSEYDFIFTARTHLIPNYKELGARCVKNVDWYYLPKYQHTVEVSEKDKLKYGSDIAFVGSWSNRREQFISSLEGLNIVVWGNGWHHASKRFKRIIECRQPVFANDMAKVMCSSKININILTLENRDSTNLRNFEVPACGGFQLCERSTRIVELFEENYEIACFSTPQELRLQAQYYLDNPEYRELIRLRGVSRLMMGKHTMLDRAEKIIEYIYG